MKMESEIKALEADLTIVESERDNLRNNLNELKANLMTFVDNASIINKTDNKHELKVEQECSADPIEITQSAKKRRILEKDFKSK